MKEKQNQFPNHNNEAMKDILGSNELSEVEARKMPAGSTFDMEEATNRILENEDGHADLMRDLSENRDTYTEEVVDADGTTKIVPKDVTKDALHVNDEIIITKDGRMFIKGFVLPKPDSDKK